MDNSIVIYKECENILTQFETMNKKELTEFFNLLEDFSVHYKRLKQQLPYHINIIDELHVNENANSRILAALLKYNENGEYTMLKSFVHNRLQNWNIEVSEPVITSEDWRIDLLVREKGKYAIIFENKIYDAVLQKNQLARYIIKMRDEGFEDRQIHVVFLPPDYYEPNECSWKEPGVCCESCEDYSQCPLGDSSSLKSLFEERFKVITFREDIIKWLNEEVLPNCRQKEVYLYSASMQYLDYLKGYFDLRTINKSMNMELKDYLIEKLQLENLEDEQQLQLLDNKTKEIQQLLSQMNEIKDSVRKKIAISDRNNWASIMNTIRKEATSVAEKLELQCAADFVFPDSEEDSHLFVSFFKPDWDLSIIFEKFNYVALQSFFIYIGKPAEQNVDSKYNNICRIFRERSEQWNHPYGWEYDEKYHQKSKDLMRDVENGNFEMYLERKVKEILQQINENQLPMQ